MDIDRTFASSSTTHRCSSPGDRNRPTLSADHICTLCRLSLRMQMKTRGWCSVVSGHAAHVVLSRWKVHRRLFDARDGGGGESTSTAASLGISRARFMGLTFRRGLH